MSGEEACGGCTGLGSHSRWCPDQVGGRAAALGRAADALDTLGDRVGPVDGDAGNSLYGLAQTFRARALVAVEDHKRQVEQRKAEQRGEGLWPGERGDR